MLIQRLTILLIVFSVVAGNAFAGNYCDLADDVTEKAVATFESDQNDGLKLFIIARELCLNDAANDYNLGVAYYRYGSLSEAQKSLEEAVQKDDSHAGALNNLAQVILEQQGEGGEALRYAEKAVALVNSPATQETLARARFAVGQEVEALDGLHKALAESSEKRLKLSYDDLLDRYLVIQVERIKAGQQQ